MFAQFSSWFLILLLTFSVAAKDVVVGFCLCERALFLSDIPCQDGVAEDSCCNSCEGELTNETRPCDDCFIALSVEISDYTWLPGTSRPKPPLERPIAQSSGLPLLAQSPVSCLRLNHSLWVPPPPETPICLRLQIFQI